ncbi:RagB/SusD family nutrient uptake outer membrane protein, partial [Flavobacterium zepuense]
MKKIILLITISTLLSCGKKLDLKPDSTLVLPKTAQDFENLLDNTGVMNITPALAQLSADEYYITSFTLYQSLQDPIIRNAYIWKPDVYEGETQLGDWRAPYAQIFYSNNVLDIMSTQDITNDPEKQRIKGWALFDRAYAFYALVSNFSKAYNRQTANTDLGIPLRLSSDITMNVPRSSVEQAYDQIIKDALESSKLLQQDIITGKKNRPSKVASYALLARVYLSMRDYGQAELYADKCLALYSKLTDYNSLEIRRGSSFTYNSEETIYFTQQRVDYDRVTYGSGGLYSVDTALISLYSASDLRKDIYFTSNANG